ncbi:helix-turn-helix domain-containing protein [Caballeronia sp. LZ034LL]|uniref:helix-turn-helix domain-containing protein n=1 Tax=Caballeronia sp. LZ034LL TaxID=3038567 RepID=UPI0028553E68|nr:helix-turn-helix domain-containing protein [Caballeronia sp. LZ034LL]MDR5839356.1 helix-turn-helix domain-containing protein [Caballeronia sp. LZ034LL]
MVQDEKEQFELFQAETTWFHIFRSMMDSGDAAKMGGNAFMIYCIIKGHTNFKTGRAFPGIDTIMEKSGLSKSQVLRELTTLEDMGYITRAKEGRKNVYTLREKIGITDDKGRPVADATWDYVPDGVRGAVAELKHVMMSGDFKGAKIINIENMTVHFNQFNDQATQINMQALMENMDKLDPKTRESLRMRLEEVQERSSG